MMNKQRIAAALLLVAVCSHTTAWVQGVSYQEDKEFNLWLSQHHGQGDNLQLEAIYPTWKKNADLVKHHNSLGLSYSLVLNKFAHLDPKDLVNDGFKMFPTVSEAKEPVAASKLSDSLPSSVDWREKGVVPPVVDQGQCDSSGVYPVVDSIDALWAIKYPGKLVLASYQEFIDCCLNGSCRGATWDKSLYQCVVKLGGLASDYHSSNGTCQSDKYKPIVAINDADYVLPHGDERALAEVVAEQPVAVAVDASRSDFQLYKGGIYYNSTCSSAKVDHAMLVVGYGTQGSGEDYWIVKNAWGKDWGMDGYILMARNRDNNCGIASQAMYPVMFCDSSETC